MPPAKKEEKKWTSGRIGAWVGIVSGVLAIMGTLAVYVDNIIVTDSELKQSEERIIQKIEHEAVKTRSVYIAELIERKTRLEEQLEEATSPGKIQVLTNKINTLNERIRKLRGE